MTVSIKKMSAGDGYRYLLRTVAVSDGDRSLSTPLTRDYAEAGSPPGRWMGRGRVGVATRAGRPGVVERLVYLLGQLSRLPLEEVRLARVQLDAYPLHVRQQTGLGETVHLDRGPQADIDADPDVEHRSHHLLESLLGKVHSRAIDAFPLADHRDAFGEVADDPRAGCQSDLDRHTHLVRGLANSAAGFAHDRGVQSFCARLVAHVQMHTCRTGLEACPKVRYEFVQRHRDGGVHIPVQRTVRCYLKHVADATTAHPARSSLLWT
jgi:hypothetical protein